MLALGENIVTKIFEVTISRVIVINSRSFIGDVTN